MTQLKDLFKTKLLVWTNLILTITSLPWSKEEKSFLQSFINTYEFNISGKYGHEYHPFLLEKTAQSLDLLESEVQKATGDAGERIIIMGYEENCIPNYFPNLGDFKGEVIQDEESFKTFSDWSAKAHNKFGLMSGFLLKNCNDIPNANFRHIGIDKQYIFDSSMRYFQEDAFGVFYKKMGQSFQNIKSYLHLNQWKNTLGTLINFWQELYHTEARTGDYKVVGTQDILFTIENAKHLVQSPIKLRNFFTGGDITYPISITELCKKEATENSQLFCSEFFKQLSPVNEENTIYVFKSFVDGVGKSTLLGNIENYMKYGNDFEKYEPVDNTSSIFANIFQFSDKVFIADLPAQMSHFTYKPTGKVYVDVNAVNLNKETIDDAKKYCLKNWHSIKKEYLSSAEEVSTLCKKGSFFEPVFCEENPEKIFIQNLINLNQIQNNIWIPFKHNQEFYLINEESKQIKILTPLEFARSEGLKNADPSQMLFVSGVAMPPSYNCFVENLTQRVKEKNIKKVVFVDFLSMYSRSSRENIRVNFLLQLMGKIINNFDSRKTLYSNFTSNSHLLGILGDDGNKKTFVENICNESLLRMLLFKLISEKKDMEASYSEKEMHEKISEMYKHLKREDIDEVLEIANEKCSSEIKHLQNIYGKTKEFKNVYELSLNQVVTLSNAIQEFFTRKIKNCSLNRYFKKFSQPIKGDLSFLKYGKQENLVIKTKDNEQVILKYILHPQCKNPVLLEPFISQLRRSWYKLIFNLIDAKLENDFFVLNHTPRFQDNYLLVSKDEAGNICLLQSNFEDHDHSQIGDIDNKIKSQKFTNFQIKFELYKNTYQGIFGFGFNPYSKKNNLCSLESTITNIVNKHQLDQEGISLSASEACKLFETHIQNTYFNPRRHIRCKAKRNSSFLEKKDSKLDQLKKNSQNNEKIFLMIEEDEIPPICQIASMISTVEMVVRDINGHIAVGKNKQEFFNAIKLFEEIMLPNYLGIVIKKSLISTNPNLLKPLIKLK